MTSCLRLWSSLLCAALIVPLTGASLAAADETLKDVVGGKDHPLVSRFAGSALVGYVELPFEQATFPLTAEVKNNAFVKPQVVEGTITRIAYIAQPGKGVLEVTRNYEDALARAGLVKRFTCAKAACSTTERIQGPFIKYNNEMKQVQSYGGYSDMAFLVLNSGNDPYYFWGTMKSGGRDVYVSVYTAKMDASEGSPLRSRTGTFIEVVEPKATPMGQVTVDVNGMQKGLAADGKVALYGVFFDTGKADIKPESKPQLDEMAKLLNADKTVRVFIVGHTDNQGGFDANLALSQRRAEAIAAALVGTYKIDARRLAAKGVANMAPVASNDAEDGRARNRRVELVKQ